MNKKPIQFLKAVQRSFFRVLIIVFVLSSNSLAGTFMLPDTGQTTCYDGAGNVIAPCPAPGDPLAQDGSYSINPLAYTDNGTVTDSNTGLIWQKEDDGNTYNWYQATGEVNSSYNPSGGSYKNVCGELGAGWRLPTKKELMSIVDYSKPYPGPTINPIFTNTKQSKYWSSTTLASYLTSAWYVRFDDGTVGDGGKYGAMSVRCVSDGESELSSFTNNGNGTVTDAKTGLVWQQGEPGAMTWPDALNYCENLELPSENGQGAWRLPNIKELESISDDAVFDPVNHPIAINTNAFPNAIANGYWSSTTNAYYPVSAWAVSFGWGVSLDVSKIYAAYVRCVRGGNITPPPPSPLTFIYPMDEWNPGTYYFGFFPWLDKYCSKTVREGRKGKKTYKYPMVHTGVDVNVGVSNINKPVKSSAKGIIKGVCFDPAWKYALIIEHDQDGNEETTDDKITSVYWHINVNPELKIALPRRKACLSVIPPLEVEQNDIIGSIADLRRNSHLHFGLRLAPFDVNLSAKGALPSQACGGNPGFPEHFDDPKFYLSE